MGYLYLTFLFLINVCLLIIIFVNLPEYSYRLWSEINADDDDDDDDDSITCPDSPVFHPYD